VVHSLSIIASLAQGPDSCRHVWDECGDILLDRARSNDDQYCKLALSGIRHLTLSPSLQPALCERGVVAVVLDVLERHDEAGKQDTRHHCHLHAVLILRNLLASTSHTDMMRILQTDAVSTATVAGVIAAATRCVCVCVCGCVCVGVSCLILPYPALCCLALPCLA
jgi:hypothetical protein